MKLPAIFVTALTVLSACQTTSLNSETSAEICRQWRGGFNLASRADTLETARNQTQEALVLEATCGEV